MAASRVVQKVFFSAIKQKFIHLPNLIDKTYLLVNLGKFKHFLLFFKNKSFVCYFYFLGAIFASVLSAPILSLRFVVIAPDFDESGKGDERSRALAKGSRQLRIGLLENGHNIIAVLPADIFLGQRLAQLQPDMIIVDAESEARDALEHVVMATRGARRPIVLFTNNNDTMHVKDAVAAGVSAYIVAGLSLERIRPILEVAIARFEHEQSLRQELVNVKTEPQDRKVIDRAKGLLMQRQGLSEKLAYEKLRKAAMDKGLRLSKIAQRMVDAACLLG